jgi:hypothetical protein
VVHTISLQQVTQVNAPGAVQMEEQAARNSTTWGVISFPMMHFTSALIIEIKCTKCNWSEHMAEATNSLVFRNKTTFSENSMLHYHHHHHR